MKKFIVLLGFVVLLSTTLALGGNDPVEIVRSKQKDLFVIKADREFVGAKVEIFYSNGDVVTRQILQKRRMIVDFAHVKEGEYIIRVSKGERIEEFEYRKV